LAIALCADGEQDVGKFTSPNRSAARAAVATDLVACAEQGKAAIAIATAKATHRMLASLTLEPNYKAKRPSECEATS